MQIKQLRHEVPHQYKPPPISRKAMLDTSFYTAMDKILEDSYEYDDKRSNSDNTNKTVAAPAAEVTISDVSTHSAVSVARENPDQDMKESSDGQPGPNDIVCGRDRLAHK